MQNFIEGTVLNNLIINPNAFLLLFSHHLSNYCAARNKYDLNAIITI